jgi:activator of 2-hydroxyglutaryl-CoA dehydratase
MWDRSGVKYLTYFWPENGNCVIFDESNAVLDEIYGARAHDICLACMVVVVLRMLPWFLQTCID